MDIGAFKTFINYYGKTRQRTLKLIATIPPDRVEWTYHPSKFTLGDIIRHLANAERYMYGENAQFRPSAYPGHGKEFAEGYDHIVAYMNKLHEESMVIFGQIKAEDLEKKVITPGNTPIRLWKWLRLMAEHEIHHRGQLYTYLGMLEVTVPPIYGLTEQQMHKNSI